VTAGVTTNFAGNDWVATGAIQGNQGHHGEGKGSGGKFTVARYSAA